MKLRIVMSVASLSMLSLSGPVHALNANATCPASSLALHAIDPLYSPAPLQQMQMSSMSTTSAVDNGIRHMTELALSRMEVSEEITPETTALFGDKVDMNTGIVSFEHVDVALQGNFALPVEIRRVYKGSKSNRFNSASFGDWTLEVPSITTTTLRYVDNDLSHTPLCNVPQESYLDTGYATIERSQYWSGDFLHIPGVMNQRILQEKENATAHSQFFAENWKVFPLTDRYGFEAISPEGTIYTFDVVRLIPAGQIPIQQEIEPRITSIADAPLRPTYTMNVQVSRVEDRHGNWVNYNYGNASTVAHNGNANYFTYSNKLTSITASDNRSIQINYEQGFNTDRIASVTHDGRMWEYTYEEAYDARLQVSKDVLKTVKRPDGRLWNFDLQFDLYGGYENNGAGVLDCAAPYPLTKVSEMTHPNGAKFTLTQQATSFGRTNVPYTSDGSGFHQNVPRCFTSMAIVEKELDFNNEVLRWDYSYSQNAGSPKQTAGSAPPPEALPGLPFIPSGYTDMHLRSSSVSNPDGSRTTHVFNREFGALEGKEVLTLYYDTDNSTLLRAIERDYTLVSNNGSAGFESCKPPQYPVISIGICDSPSMYSKVFDNPAQHENHIYPSVIKTTDYGSGGSTVFTTEYSQYNAYGKPLVVKEGSTFGTQYTRTTYQHNTQQWVLNLPIETELSSNNSQWTTVSERTYHATSLLPNLEKRFGQTVISAQTYHADGNLLRQTYNAPNRYIELRGYEFGIPTDIRVPSRYTTSGYEQAVQTVNTRGWVAAIENFNGVTTGYEYDVMGRVTRIVPQGTFVATDITYQNTVDDYFVQTITRGSSYTKTTRMDGLLRPVHIEESASGADNRVIEQQFDAYNNPVFVSYPSISSGESDGTVYEYDGLQRLKAQYSNVSFSGETREYLSGNRVRSTNARNYSTTTTFRALGSPSYEQVERIVQPEGVTTNITYNLFGNPTQITQGGETEVRRYNAQQNLCRVVRNDVGHAVYDYNALGEVTWEAKGASGSGTDCDLASVTAAQKSHITYDNVGSVRTISYPDASGTITHTYDAQGNLLTLASGNSTWAYTYNTLGQVMSEALSVDGQQFNFASHYNTLGHLTTHVYPSGRVVNYAPNGYGEARQSGGYANNVSYAPSGQVESFDYANGLSFNQTLDSQRRPELRTISDVQALFSHSYQYD
ncbi:hypothetical protein A28LD_0350, partial [Idiomarina sp. A28L]|uniref:RHS repeat protein n=1 Tax=Idiomarina sp. A28L TaxID=1036674 RepID=UPI0002138A5F